MEKLPLKEFFGQDSFEKSFNLSFLFRKQIFTPKDLNVTYTNLNYWDKQGILSSSKKGKSAWRSFNFIDYVWLRVIDELRELGFPTWQIKEARNFFFRPLELDYKKIYETLNKDEINSLMPFEPGVNKVLVQNMNKRMEHYSLQKAKKDGFTYFFYAICATILEKTPVSLLIFQDDYDIWIENKKKFYREDFLYKKATHSYISISLSNIIKDFLLDENLIFALPQLELLPPNQIRLLEIINSGNYEVITINFKDKKMKSLNLTKKQDTKSKMVDIINEGRYQDISVKIHDGMIAVVENTIKEFVNNE